MHESDKTSSESSKFSVEEKRVHDEADTFCSDASRSTASEKLWIRLTKAQIWLSFV